MKKVMERIKVKKEEEGRLAVVKTVIRWLEERKSNITGVKRKNYKDSERDNGCGLVRVGTFLE
jgi:hypothetical protein